MTKEGSFRRAVRREARVAGLSYTQVLARRARERNTVDGRAIAERVVARLTDGGAER